MGIENQRIVEVRELTPKEHNKLYWPEDNLRTPIALVLDDGTVLFASQDPEGNGPGHIVGIPENKDVLVDAEIDGARPLTDQEFKNFGWATNHPDVPVVKIKPTDESELDEQIRVFPTADPERNGPGELWGMEPSADDDHPQVFAVGF